jgi:hypothetical protein
VELKDFRPRIWRLFEVNADASITVFVQIIMCLFKMYGGHLIELVFRSKKLGLKKTEFCTSVFDEYKNPPKKSLTKLNRVFAEIGDKFLVTYDYGDNWRLVGTLKKIYADPGLKNDELPRILKGFGHGIIEDCGGTWGLEEIVKGCRGEQCDLESEILETYVEGGFNIESFDLAEENENLKSNIANPEIFLGKVEKIW